MIRLLIVDDQPATRQGLRMWLEEAPDLQVVGEAADGPAALAAVAALDPDVVLMDVRMPGMDGITAAAELRIVAPRVAVVIHSLYDDAATRARAAAAGAAAFVPKHWPEARLLDVLGDVAPRGLPTDGRS